MVKNNYWRQKYNINRKAQKLSLPFANRTLIFIPINHHSPGNDRYQRKETANQHIQQRYHQRKGKDNTHARCRSNPAVHITHTVTHPYTLALYRIV